MRFSLYNFAAQEGCESLVGRLQSEGYTLRRLDGSGIASAADLWASSSRQLGHRLAAGWDGHADYLAAALMPDDDEAGNVALLWEHADHLANADLGGFCAAFDTLTTIARAAYAQGTTILLFFLGDGPGFATM